MSFIRIKLNTSDVGIVNIDSSVECSSTELEVAVEFLMMRLAASSSSGLEVLNSIMSDINELMNEPQYGNLAIS